MNKSIFFSVEEILNEVFFNNVDESILLLKKYELYDIVQQNLSYLKNKKERDTKKVFDTITISFLQTVNTILHAIEDIDIRNDLKYILSNIGHYIIDNFADYQILTITELKSLRESLISLSEIKGYNFKDIDSHLQLNRLIRKMENKSTVASNDMPKVYYDWLGNINKLDEIADNLYSERAIKSVKTFKKLFKPEPVNLEINPAKSDLVFVLFDILHEKKLIQPKNRRGKFLALKQHSVDLQGKVLFKKAPKYIKQEIKKREETYYQLRAKAEKWIE
ncbi:hypothetical protein [uncultured Winogradskyella sp.]|uniref:hypothetical protein n=1 Tax=uncultured Winogradskyella sp. TaxID=395353 RepID=UPI0026127C17|nr:hypothetical protein [uncultured Winogradskyella sp.]